MNSMYGYGYPYGYYSDSLYSILFIISIFVMLFSVYASFLVNSTFDKFKKQICNSNLTASEVARKILDANGLFYVSINSQEGKLSDHFNSANKTITLSSEVYDNKSIAAIAVAAHEVGHAIQDKEGSILMRIRHALAPVLYFSRGYSVNLFAIGLIVRIFAHKIALFLMGIGLIAFLFAVIFDLVTLPLEILASEKAKRNLIKLGIINEKEKKIVVKVLKAAALTYVAALSNSFIEFLKYLVIFLNEKNDRD